MFSRSVVFCFIISYTLYGQGDLEKGIDYYNNRQDGSTKSAAVITPINNAISSLTKALNNTTTQEQEALYLMKSYYFRGKYVHDDIENKKINTRIRNQIVTRILINTHFLQDIPKNSESEINYTFFQRISHSRICDQQWLGWDLDFTFSV